MGIGMLVGSCGVEWRASLHDWLQGGDPRCAAGTSPARRLVNTQTQNSTPDPAGMQRQLICEADQVHRHKAISHNTACKFVDAVGPCRYVRSDEQLRERKPHRENATARCTCQSQVRFKRNVGRCVGASHDGRTGDPTNAMVRGWPGRAGGGWTDGHLETGWPHGRDVGCRA